ncbi:MAG: hypothetical protein IJ327_03575 [Lachnospiraceae bacterium]|nr:hypothetical protein [Lachnospiraceae bacterium]
MVYSIKSILLLCSLAVMTIYLIVAADEDAKSFEVTRLKHLIGFIPAELILLVYVKERSLFDIGMIALFVLLCLVMGMMRIYGMADGFVFANLILLFGGVGGTAGIGLVILIMILACFSGMTEMLLRKMVTMAGFRRNRHIAFVPHILTGYTAVMVALFIWFR